MFASFSEAVTYLQKNLNTYDPNNPFDEEEVRDILFDNVFTKIDDEVLESIFTGDDRELLAQDGDNEELIISMLASRIPNFYANMTETVAELLQEYMDDDEDEE